jgi:hypothetical protein
MIDAPGETLANVPMPPPFNIRYVARGKDVVPVPVTDLAHGDPGAVVLSTVYKVPTPGIPYIIEVMWHGQYGQPTLPTMTVEASIEIGGVLLPAPEHQTSQFGTAPTKEETRMQVMWVQTIVPATCIIPINIYSVTPDVGESASIANQQMHIRGWYG